MNTKRVDNIKKILEKLGTKIQVLIAVLWVVGGVSAAAEGL
jgi:hypothetical protein